MCPEAPNWFAEKIASFFGPNMCEGTERWAQCQVIIFISLLSNHILTSLRCQATIGKGYNDLRPRTPDFHWHKRIGGEPVTGKIEAVLDAATTDYRGADGRPRTTCPDGVTDPWEADPENPCKITDKLSFKVSIDRKCFFCSNTIENITEKRCLPVLGLVWKRTKAVMCINTTPTRHVLKSQLPTCKSNRRSTLPG